MNNYTNINIPSHAIACKILSWTYHHSGINTFDNDIVNSFAILYGLVCIPRGKTSVNHNVPGFNDYVDDQHNVAI